MTLELKLSRRKMLGYGAIGVAAAATGSAGTVAAQTANRYDAPAPVPAGQLSVTSDGDLRATVGGYRVDIGPQRWLITAPNGVVLWNVAQAPVTALRASLRWHETLGHFSSDRDLASASDRFRVTRSTVEDASVTAVGVLESQGEWTLPVRVTLAADDPRRLRVTVHSDGTDALMISLGRSSGEAVHGLGEQFAPFDLDGQFVPVVTREQGIGRGRQPLTFLAELTNGAGGDLLTTYAPLPFVVTSAMRGIALAGTHYSAWDFRQAGRLDITRWAPSAELTLYSGDEPASLVTARTADTGRPSAPARWVAEGAVLGLQGGTAAVRRKLGVVRAAGAPVSAVWLQDWVGTRVTSFGDRLWWNWQLDEQHYPGWNDLVDELHADGIKVLTYINPYLVGDKPGAGRNLFAEADRLGYLVRSPHGGPYLLDQGEFSAAMVDLSNPDARAWYTGVIVDEVIGVGADGWMADFGEALPFDAVLARGEPAEWHNRWPDEWARINSDARQIAGVEDAMVFHRSAGPATPGLAPMMWAGDQLPTFGQYDGLRSALRGMLAAGVSGVPFVHSDVGGYTGLAQPIVGVRRSPEVLARWAELSAWGPMLRTHEGNQPDRFAQVYDNAHRAGVFAAQARVFAALAEYRLRVAETAASTGVPVLRHTWLAARDSAAATADEQFFFGDSFLVAPVMAEGARTVTAYLPPGSWIHLWSGRRYSGGSSGRAVTVDAPIGRPGVFYRAGDAVAKNLRPRLLRALRG